MCKFERYIYTYKVYETCDCVGIIGELYMPNTYLFLELNLDYCHGIDDKGFSYLEKLNGLEHLNLRNTSIKTERLYKILQKNQRMREVNFKLLVCMRNTALIQFINLCPNLEVIRLENFINYTSQDIDVFADCKNLRKVYLPRFQCPIADYSNRLHRLLPSWQRLELFALCCIVLTDHNLKLLTQCKNLKQLQLYWVKLVTPDKCFTILEQCPKLQEFRLIHCNINDCLINEWKERYPHVSICTLE
ncbi:F-box/LRR-repeat protein 15-like [Temnothorax curvispinosus]|uniref:F-box/LRR-repeat protein 15-like n=1 Tax=Temnothorax curvispinosus TaxID=300111 RepID=A0A6J1RMN2_9HYME|nr:F-box/LRR-repeat protein 15-like [Temnothorax curvispinosus]XP_024893955.1 F-box/LRR-repeat protein 15-like [Temnothorax curvispinosus]